MYHNRGREMQTDRYSSEVIGSIQNFQKMKRGTYKDFDGHFALYLRITSLTERQKKKKIEDVGRRTSGRE
jgi:hypothetical protein